MFYIFFFRRASLLATRPGDALDVSPDRAHSTCRHTRGPWLLDKPRSATQVGHHGVEHVVTTVVSKRSAASNLAGVKHLIVLNEAASVDDVPQIIIVRGPVLKDRLDNVAFDTGHKSRPPFFSHGKKHSAYIIPAFFLKFQF